MNQLAIEISAIGDFGDHLNKGIYIGDTEQSIIELNKEFIKFQSEKIGFTNFTIRQEHDDHFEVAYSGGMDQKIYFTDIVFAGNSIRNAGNNLHLSSSEYATFLISKGFKKLKTEKVCVELD